ncbi:Eco57I restriction-modification methylase domain-containing protein, partial [Candidatus Desantisbacteria bacterium]|nr:Eco57I restriction-modification methylase domain-containing protein [Candidatus Desantisbacteria bacterium]
MQTINKTRFNQLIKGFQFTELFNELGWDYVKKAEKVVLNETEYLLNAVADKKGFVIFVCTASNNENIPDYSIRKKIDNIITKLYFEHLIIFCDAAGRHQIWQLVIREQGKPVVTRETHYYSHQEPELLFQKLKGLFFSIDDEDRISIVDVKSVVTEQFNTNAEKVTKKFYEGFKKEHTAFLEFIKGIDDQLNMDWYASLMLNRLMFCYFIQKKGFLDNNKNYLQDKLKVCKEKKGTNQFYSFYRDFLLALFREGLGLPEQSRNLEVEIGKIPYLNGGLFDEHEIEKTYKEISIDDKAFERLFTFFDQWEWHLDTRETASGKDINPDVIGYIFEKYINDRAQMGAYYTKPDITDYIAKNCIIPWLFDEVKRQYGRGGFQTRPFQTRPFADDGWLWQMVKTSGDEYIYDAVKYGISVGAGLEPARTEPARTEPARILLFNDLPEEIQKGFNMELENKLVDGNDPWLWELRKSWNKPAPSDIALPTEIYREVIERRKRYADIKGKIANGEIREINDFITYNLNIRQFAQDVLETTEDAEFIRYFYKALSSITILDPTCGSGAFLFAAMNILELLYEACIQRMRGFVDESSKGKHKFFEETLAQVNAPEHPNLQYFIYKSIILNNLYGVDIMNEAVEIAKLRLFLKLVATVDADYCKPNMGLEPLPDVDFNIRAGNTLVGYATKKQIDSISGFFVPEAHKKKILEQCDIVARAFARYKEIQLSSGDDYDGFKKAKDDLNGDILEKEEYKKWLATHQPFHWFAEFYEIIASKSGFDVVIGNPPYVEYSKVRKSYTIQNYTTESSGNLYAFAIERSNALLTTIGHFGFIIPISFVCTQRMEPAQDIILKNSSNVFLSDYAERPSKLFTGAEVLLTIVLSQKRNSSHSKVYSTGFTKWSVEERSYLFERTNYTPVSKLKSYVLPKVSSLVEEGLLQKIKSKSAILGVHFRKSSKHAIYYRIGGGRYWKIFTNFQPKFILNGKNGISSRENYLYFSDQETCDCSIAILSSSHFYWYFILTTNCRDLNPSDLQEFPITLDSMSRKQSTILSKLCDQLMQEYNQKSCMKEKTSSLTGNIVYQEFYPRLSKPILDEIDRVLAQHYGL